MACCTCANCQWMGNDTKCPECGERTHWDERDYSIEGDDEDEEE